jgi:hypothetical protein
MLSVKSGFSLIPESGEAMKTSHHAAEGGEAVRRTVEAMQEISDKISVIEDIAYSTNLLALNAAIERLPVPVLTARGVQQISLGVEHLNSAFQASVESASKLTERPLSGATTHNFYVTDIVYIPVRGLLLLTKSLLYVSCKTKQQLPACIL